MTALTWITLIVIGGLVWGGLAYFASLALRSERGRTEDGGGTLPRDR